MLWPLAITPSPRLADTWDPVRALAREFRMAAGQHAGDERVNDVAAALRSRAPWLRPVWDCHGVGSFGAPALRLDDRPAHAHLLRPSDTGSAVLVLAG